MIVDVLHFAFVSVTASAIVVLGFACRPWSWRRYLRRVAVGSTVLPTILAWMYLTAWSPVLGWSLWAVAALFSALYLAGRLLRSWQAWRAEVPRP